MVDSEKNDVLNGLLDVELEIKISALRLDENMDKKIKQANHFSEPH